MTIAAAFASFQGVVLAADTKESYGDTHTYVDKITTVYESNATGAIASAGNACILDYITPFIEAVMGSEEVTTSTAFEMRLQALMARLYDSPEMKSFPIEKTEDLYTQFLIAVKHKDEKEVSVFSVNSTLVVRFKGLGAIIGCGPMRQMGEELGMMSSSKLERAKAAALWVVYEAKRRYSDVGGITQIVTIANDGTLTREPAESHAEQEVILNDIRTFNALVALTILDPNATNAHLRTVMTRVNRRLTGLHKEAVKLDARHRERRKEVIKAVMGRKKYKP